MGGQAVVGQQLKPGYDRDRSIAGVHTAWKEKYI